jgi:hypothetical protein
MKGKQPLLVKNYGEYSIVYLIEWEVQPVGYTTIPEKFKKGGEISRTYRGKFKIHLAKSDWVVEEMLAESFVPEGEILFTAAEGEFSYWIENGLVIFSYKGKLDEDVKQEIDSELPEFLENLAKLINNVPEGVEIKAVREE